MLSNRLGEARRLWDGEAKSFDEEPDHGMRDPHIREAWRAKLESWLPAVDTPVTVLDLGCGTGSLSVLLASLGHDVTGVDISPRMLERARAKARKARQTVQFHLMDAAEPSLGPSQFEVILCRHLLWTLPSPAQALSRWAEMLNPGGRLVLIEGNWYTGVGLRASETLAALPPFLTDTTIEDLSPQTDLWGKAVTDERYAILATISC
ncbi:MAG: class I SAM-dependent methyltransferase [Armatimonadota bacterium]